METLRPGSLTTAQKDALIEQVKQEIAVASVHEFITVKNNELICDLFENKFFIVINLNILNF